MHPLKFRRSPGGKAKPQIPGAKAMTEFGPAAAYLDRTWDNLDFHMHRRGHTCRGCPASGPVRTELGIACISERSALPEPQVMSHAPVPGSRVRTPPPPIAILWAGSAAVVPTLIRLAMEPW
jgi:hypothetical protein